MHSNRLMLLREIKGKRPQTNDPAFLRHHEYLIRHGGISLEEAMPMTYAYPATTDREQILEHERRHRDYVREVLVLCRDLDSERASTGDADLRWVSWILHYAAGHGRNLTARASFDADLQQELADADYRLVETLLATEFRDVEWRPDALFQWMKHRGHIKPAEEPISLRPYTEMI
jgi:hypothetical protein